MKKQQGKIGLLLKEIEIKNTFQKREQLQMINNFMLTGLFTEEEIKNKTYKLLFSIISTTLYDQKSNIQNLKEELRSLKNDYETLKYS